VWTVLQLVDFLCSKPEIWIFNAKFDIYTLKKSTNPSLYPPKMEQFFVNFFQSLSLGWHFPCRMNFSNLFVPFLHVFEHTHCFFGYTLLFRVFPCLKSQMTSQIHHQHLKRCAVKTTFSQYRTCGRNFSGWRVIAKIVQQCQYINCCGPWRFLSPEKSKFGLAHNQPYNSPGDRGVQIL